MLIKLNLHVFSTFQIFHHLLKKKKKIRAVIHESEGQGYLLFYFFYFFMFILFYFIFTFYFIFILFYFISFYLVTLGLCCACGLSLIAVSGATLPCSAGAWGGISCCGSQAVGMEA